MTKNKKDLPTISGEDFRRDPARAWARVEQKGAHALLDANGNRRAVLHAMREVPAEAAQTRVASIHEAMADDTSIIWRAVCAICKSERRCTRDLGEYETALPICDGCGHRMEDGWVRWDEATEREQGER